MKALRTPLTTAALLATLAGSAMAQMGPQMLAPGIGHADLAILTAPDRQVLREIAQRLDLPDRHKIGLLQRIPAIGKANIEPPLGWTGTLIQWRDPPIDQILPPQLFQYLPYCHRWGAGIGYACRVAHVWLLLP